MKKILSFKNYNENIIIPEGSIDTNDSMDTEHIKALGSIPENLLNKAELDVFENRKEPDGKGGWNYIYKEGEGKGSELEKGGEGSKGGHIIGHTKSGKPIYNSSTHKLHKDFDKNDHLDAAEVHKNEEKNTKEEKAKKYHREEAAFHNTMSAIKDRHAVKMYNNWR